MIGSLPDASVRLGTVGASFYHFFLPVWLAKLTSRRKYYIQLCRSVIFISGLAITNKFVNYAVVDVFITFLTDERFNVTIVHAVALTNLGEGLYELALILMTAVSSSYACYQKLILSSTAAYVVGLSVLCLNAFKVEAFLKIPEAVYYSYMLVVVVLIYVGKAGSKPILDNFFKGQLRFHEPKGEESYKRVKARFKVWRVVAWLLALVPILSTSDFDWPVMFLISSSMLAATALLLWCGTSFYHPIDPIINVPPTVAFRVLTAAIAQRNAPYPTTPDKFFHCNSSSDKLILQENENEVRVLPLIRFCRWVDKAAIKDQPTITPEEQERMFRTVTRVRETKHILTMVPIWVVFLGFGVARATWNTFFFEQADDISKGREITVTTLLVIRTVSQDSVSYLWELISGRILSTRKRYRFLKLRICVGMLLSSVTFVVAWHIAKGKPDTTWVLAPQFCLSGLAEGLALDGLGVFYNYQVPESMRGYGEVLNGVVTGFGSLLSIVCLYASRSKCFTGKNLKSSRLDRYYALIAVLNFVYFMVGSYAVFAWYGYNSDVAETGPLNSEGMFTKDPSDDEKRLHDQVVDTLGVDPKIREDD